MVNRYFELTLNSILTDVNNWERFLVYQFTLDDITLYQSKLETRFKKVFWAASINLLNFAQLKEKKQVILFSTAFHQFHIPYT